MEIHNFAIKTKENPKNPFEGTEVLAHIQQFEKEMPDGTILTEKTLTKKLTEYPQNIQDAAMALFSLVSQYHIND